MTVEPKSNSYSARPGQEKSDSNSKKKERTPSKKITYEQNKG